MKIGTKSVLFGAHQFLIHPWFVAAAWWKLYGFPWDPRLWVAFILHDLGYWGKPNMDGPEGETHVEWAANVMGYLFDRNRASCPMCNGAGKYWAAYWAVASAAAAAAASAAYWAAYWAAGAVLDKDAEREWQVNHLIEMLEGEDRR
jgi:hypothetical protein